MTFFKDDKLLRNELFAAGEQHAKKGYLNFYALQGEFSPLLDKSSDRDELVDEIVRGFLAGMGDGDSGYPDGNTVR